MTLVRFFSKFGLLPVSSTHTRAGSVNVFSSNLFFDHGQRAGELQVGEGNMIKVWDVLHEHLRMVLGFFRLTVRA
jgi:hypothetical protein